MSTNPEKSPQTPEQRLEQAGEEMGRVLQSLSAEIKAIVREIKENVDKEFEEQQKQGNYIDRSMFFAAALIGHPDVKDDNLIRAAANYVDADHAYVKWQNSQEA